MIWLLLAVLALGVLGHALGRRRALALVDGDARRLHSRPPYYGYSVLILTIVPALLLLAGWSLVAPILVDGQIVSALGAQAGADAGDTSLAMADIRRLADGLDAAVQAGAMTEQGIAGLQAGTDDIRATLGQVGVALGSDVAPAVLEAARDYRDLSGFYAMLQTGFVLALALGGLGVGLRRITPEFRARNITETSVLGLLIGASTIAVLTTFGIIFSMLFETISFFGQYPAVEFFLGTVWSPEFRGDSELGLLPLLWGTLYISLIALLVAVPIGLFAAIYMSEYAGPRLRAVAKPLLEVLAGIPTIVYGLFALITVGPLLRDVFAQPLGLGNSGSSVMTAGLVMGIMLIPFVSSLSDDIINAVPQSLRDGSLGLGATRSETIRNVILPAALPGIVGAVLLAASRAIGETMIVVLGAGAAAQMNLNPFEAMTTVTVKIVSQLTGDTDFSSPETLVAFALGLTLFCITLALNVVALQIVRKYREQYD